MSGPRAAVFVKVDTLGDLVLFAPALRALRTAWPATRLAVVIRRAYGDLAPLLAPQVEWIHTDLDPFNHRPDRDPAEVARLRDAVAALAPEVFAAATSRRNWLEVLLASTVPHARRVALGAAGQDEFFGTQLRVLAGLDATAAFSEFVAPPAAAPDWAANFTLVDALLGRAVERTPPRLAAPADAVAAARRWLAEKQLGPGRYAVCAAAGFANVRLKTWPADRFGALIGRLRETHCLPTVLIGHTGERDHLATVPGADATWLGGEGDLPVLAALIADSALYVGNDTGALHLAAALDVPVLGIFGGGTWPRFVPAAARGAAVVQPLPCFGCGWDCAFGDAPCLGGIAAADAFPALDDAVAGRPFAIREVRKVAAGTEALMAKVAALHRESRAGHLARQHKLEELTALDREKDETIVRQNDELVGKEQEIDALKLVCDEREKTIIVLDGHVRHFQHLSGVLQADKSVLEQTLAAQPADAALAARTISSQLVHIRNLEALVKLQEAALADLRTTEANRAAGLHDLEQAKHYGKLLAEKEAVIRALSAGLAEREKLISRLAAAGTGPTAALHRLAVAAAALVREEIFRPAEAALFRAVVERHWMQIGVLRHYAPKPLRWDDRIPAPARRDADLPQIGVVTPSYGQEAFIARTLRSVIDQAYPKLVYAVQDGGSKDGSPGIIARHAAALRHWESVRDRGQADAIGRGFGHIGGALGPDDLMAWLNSDDLLAPGALRFVGEYFAAHPDVDVVYGHRIIIDEHDRDVGRWIMPRHDPATLEWIDYVPQETMFWRKRAWDRVGGIDPSFQFALDWDLLARFQQAGCRMVRVPYFLGAFRVHSEQKTSQAIHTTGAEEMKRIRTRFHGEKQDDFATIDRFARRTRFRGALVARLLEAGIRW
ncbi:MAG: hypothetical protein B9S34_09480 [Opitutia bacterium Tous-C1TDCM]|nr:MAG: hypothetical protein B9S34_09480 [Opitutae bacterium Tous-C1TDCM]